MKVSCMVLVAMILSSVFYGAFFTARSSAVSPVLPILWDLMVWGGLIVFIFFSTYNLAAMFIPTERAERVPIKKLVQEAET